MWRAYAGSVGRTRAALSPRARTLAAVQRLLREQPESLVLSTGHSLGGTLASLFAYDLVTLAEARQTSTTTTAPAPTPSPTPTPLGQWPMRGCACVAFAPTRSFNEAFREAWACRVRAGELFAVRVSIAGDVVPLLPYDVPLYSTVHAIGPRLLLEPMQGVEASASQGGQGALTLAALAPGDDVDLRRYLPDVTAHTMHSGLLGAEMPAGKTSTVPAECEWPLARPGLDIWSMS